MGLTQIDVNIGRQDEVLMPSDLRPTVPSQGAIQLFGQLTGLFDQCLDDAESVLVANLCEHHVTRVSLDQCCDEAVAGACDEVTLPMARHGPTFHLGWPVTDRYCVVEPLTGRRLRSNHREVGPDHCAEVVAGFRTIS
jgi:hypothetical protein